MLEIAKNVSLLNHNTLGVTAQAHAYSAIDSDGDLRDALQYAEQHGLPSLVLGGGSNIVLSDDYPGLVIHMRQRGIIASPIEGGVALRVAAGENWDALLRYCLDQGWYGLENLIAIPGSVGAAPVQNIGAYGVELSHCLAWVEGWDRRLGERRRLSAEQCQLAYRDSIFKGALRDQFIITEVGLHLRHRAHANTDYPALRQFLVEHGESPEKVHPRVVAQAVAAIRAAKLPDVHAEPNAGSFFKNPLVSADVAKQLLIDFPEMAHWPMPDGQVKLAAAWLVDQCGWKGRRLGPVGVHPKQAIVLVNYQQGRGEDILALADAIIGDVARRFGVQLAIEPRVY
ncbi:UDP-N-acetylmuramate dehydrogenase [Spongiibacter sp. UBA1325]|uniref:UDP-N-acetylmuramate dehydrogenase n=1 Tax=Spongiibacter sp. UBA1325 TaxID=1947543 RepID=UPI00257E19D6|nr:UDP-N-acetylmuramate dehydrogenase [Spongiibacter sp. UBA1325]|tara:strand:- start:913 stop:1935 length:1023 start_codon:yes stop_codon:yes gene_type:complete